MLIGISRCRYMYAVAGESCWSNGAPSTIALLPAIASGLS